eukprot:935522-Alexandrium_andersonii.AAC.1
MVFALKRCRKDTAGIEDKRCANHCPTLAVFAALALNSGHPSPSLPRPSRAGVKHSCECCKWLA